MRNVINESSLHFGGYSKPNRHGQKQKSMCNLPCNQITAKKGYWRCEQSVTFYRFWTCDEKSSALRSGHKDPFTYGTKYALFELQCQSGGLPFDLRGGIGPVARFSVLPQENVARAPW